MAKLIDQKTPDAPIVVAPLKPTAAPVAAPPRDTEFWGARKLIRPRLPAFLGGRRRDAAHAEDPLTHALNEGPHAPESSHAEAFYFQKQIQQATEMTVVLDDGDELHGTLEWYDRSAIKMKLRDRSRVLVYKDGIKYLYKTSEASAHNAIMK